MSTLEGLPKPAIVRASSLERDPLKLDFKNFMWKTWKTLFDASPTALMYEVGDRLQHGPDRDILMGFRGFSKSYITVDLAMFRLNRDREEQVLTVSGSGTGAKGNADLAYSMVNGFDWLAHLKPIHGQRMSAQAFDVAGAKPKKSESFAAESLFGQVTGRRASTIIPDDVETPNTSETEGDRSRLRVRYAELGGSVLRPGGVIKVLGTSQTENTLYLELAQERGYGMFMVPAEYPIISEDPKKDELRKYYGWLAPSIREAVTSNPELGGTPTEPSRFPESELFARKLEYGVTEYERQFKLFLDAGAGLEQPLKLRDIPVMEIPAPQGMEPLRVPDEVIWSPSPANAWQDIPVDALNGDSTVYSPMRVGHWQEPESKVLIVDPSGGGLDETSWTVLAQHLGRVFLCHADQRLEGFSADTMKAIAADAKRFGVHRIHIEKNFGGGMFGELLKPHLLAAGHPCSIEEEVAGQVQKEIRIIDALEGLVTGHRLVIAAAVLRADFKVSYPNVEAAKKRFYRLTYQLTRITKKRGALAHDDRVDSLATGVAKFIGTLQRQLANAQAESREAYLKEQAEKIIETRRRQGQPLFGLEAGASRLGNFIKQASVMTGPLFPGRKNY